MLWNELGTDNVSGTYHVFRLPCPAHTSNYGLLKSKLSCGSLWRYKGMQLLYFGAIVITFRVAFLDALPSHICSSHELTLLVAFFLLTRYASLVASPERSYMSTEGSYRSGTGNNA